jgi:hypothetical protein
MSGMRAAIIAPVAVLLLAACGEDAAPEAAQGGAASGEVLPGSISDDMIPTDALRSQGPQIVETPTSAASGAVAPEGEEAAAEAVAEAGPAVADEPAAAAE